MALFDFFRDKKYKKEQKNAALNQEVGEHLLDEVTTAAGLKAFEAEQAEKEHEDIKIEEEAFTEPAGDDVEVTDLENLCREAEARARAIQEDGEKADRFRNAAIVLEVLDGKLKDSTALPLSVRGIDQEIRSIANSMVTALQRERMETVGACLEALADAVLYCRVPIPASEMEDKRSILKKRITILREYNKKIKVCDEVDQLERAIQKAELAFHECNAEYQNSVEQLSKYDPMTVSGIRSTLNENKSVPEDKPEYLEIRDLINQQNHVFTNRKLTEQTLRDHNKDLEQRKNMLNAVRARIDQLHLNYHMELPREVDETIRAWDKWNQENAENRKKLNELHMEFLARLDTEQIDDGSAEVYAMNEKMIQKKIREQKEFEDRLERMRAAEQGRAQAQGHKQGQTQGQAQSQTQDNRQLQTN